MHCINSLETYFKTTSVRELPCPGQGHTIKVKVTGQSSPMSPECDRAKKHAYQI